MSKLEFSALQFLIKNPNQKYVINDSDKNLGAAVAETEDVIKECVRQRFSQKEAAFLTSKTRLFTIPHLYIIWKILKVPPVGRPIVAGYNWILTPASIFAGHFLKEFYSKFESILTDSFSLVKYFWKKQNLTQMFLCSR